MYGEGKFFFIRSCLNGLVLDIKDNIANPGQEVVTWEYNGQDNQIWYIDTMRGVIRSRLDDNLVLHIDGDCLTVQEFHPDEYNQQWRLSGQVIQHRENPNWVFDIAEGNSEPGARVCAYDFHGEENQLWEITYIPPKRFYIRSHMHGKVLDIKRGEAEPGTKAVMYDQNEEETANQLWWEDKYGIIYSCLNNLAPDHSDDCLRMQPYDVEKVSLQWVISGFRVCRRDDLNLVWDIKGAKEKDCAKVVSYEYHGGDNQKWSFEYID